MLSVNNMSGADQVCARPQKGLQHTGKTRLITLRLNRQALIWVTVLL